MLADIQKAPFLCVLFALSLTLVHGQTPAAETPATANAPIRERSVLVPLTLGHDRVVQLHARLCLPASTGPATLVLINHGSPGANAELSKIKLGRCNQEAAQWFLIREIGRAHV